MPPTALKINLATTLRVLFFYICSRLTASSRAASVLGGIPCHRRHSKLTLRQRYAFCFLYMLAHDCKQSRGIGARRYSMPPTALKSNLATTLRVLFFYICSRMTASSRTAYIKKQPYGFCKVVFSFGAVWHNLYEPVLEEIAVLSAVSISFSVFTTCSFVSFRCSGLSVKL